MVRVKRSAAEWAEEVRQFRASGQPAEMFAKSRGYSVSTLWAWSRRVGGGEAVKFVQVVSPSMRRDSVGELVIEVGSARVRVKSGFDRELLADVVKALGAGGK